MVACPLCQSKELSTFQSPAYQRCGHCKLILKVDRPTKMEEKARYLQHHNNSDDSGYRNFLAPVVNVVASLCPPGSHGLDYGSGPTPVLSTWLKEKGYAVDAYDYFFAPNGLAKATELDFVTCIETAEHFFNPLEEFETMFARLKKGGALILMTELFHEHLFLTEWSYTRDLTHVAFYSRETLEWCAAHFGVQLHFINERLFVFILDSSLHLGERVGNQIDKIL